MSAHTFTEIARLVARHAKVEGTNATAVESLVLVRYTGSVVRGVFVIQEIVFVDQVGSRILPTTPYCDTARENALIVQILTAEGLVSPLAAA